MNAASWPLGTSAIASEGVLRKAITVFALACLVYLTLETALLAGLPPTPYWILRLLPDALIVVAAIAVVVIGDPRARTTPVRIGWVVAAVTVLIVAANTIRGLPVEDSINATRVLVRYVLLGLLLWWAVDRRDGFGSLVVGAVLVAGAIQVAVAAVQVALRLPAAVEDPVALLFLDGTFGRFDRFGLFMMTVMIALVATTDRLKTWRIGFLVACAILLYLSTSRQAMVGLGFACVILAAWPGIDRWRRVFALSVAGLAFVILLTSPSGRIPPTIVPDDGVVVRPDRPIKDSIQLTTDPNRNFRLFYNLELAPWAATVEPLMGFGPRQHVTADPDPRLAARVQAAGMDWQWARNFTNDSNYASMVLQFGVIVPVLFLLLLASVTIAVARSAWGRSDPVARFAVAFAGAALVVAWFGPAFEIRTVSIVLWLALMAALAAARGRDAGSPVAAVDGLGMPPSDRLGEDHDGLRHEREQEPAMDPAEPRLA